MRNNILYLCWLMGIVLLFSCEKDETKAYLDANPSAPAFTSPSTGTSKVLTMADSAIAITFNWTETDFGYPAEILYDLQMSKEGDNFIKPVGIASVASKNTASIITYDFDNLLLAMGLNYDVESTIEIRLRSIIKGINSSGFADTVYSEVITMNVTPFEVIVNYPKLYVCGSFQGWKEKEAPVISSVKSNDKYEGYLYFPEATTEFKMLMEPEWIEDKTIGDPDASGTTGTLQIGAWGGNNIKIPGGPGYFKLNADLVGKTYTYLKTDWGLIGDATPGKWDSDQDMTYDDVTKTWAITLDLVVGKIKFRANDGWDLNYGDEGADGKLEAGGADIDVAEAGNYTITLDLSKPIYKYTVVKN